MGISVFFPLDFSWLWTTLQQAQCIFRTTFQNSLHMQIYTLSFWKLHSTACIFPWKYPSLSKPGLVNRSSTIPGYNRLWLTEEIPWSSIHHMLLRRQHNRERRAYTLSQADLFALISNFYWSIAYTQKSAWILNIYLAGFSQNTLYNQNWYFLLLLILLSYSLRNPGQIISLSLNWAW